MKHETQTTGDEQAFTLIEILLILALISALAVVFSYPTLGRLQAKSAQTSAREIVEVSQHFAEVALTLKNDIVMRYSPGTNSIVSNCRLDGHVVTTGEFPVLVLSDGVFIARWRFGTVTESGGDLILYKNGSASPGTIEVKDSSGAHCTITQALRGRRSIRCGV